MSNFNEYNQIMLLIQNNEFDIFINQIPKIMDTEVVNLLVTTLCNTTHQSNWLELALPRFSIEVGKDIIKQNLSNLIKDEISITSLRKISVMMNNLQTSENNFERQMLIDKMLDFFHHSRENIPKDGTMIIPGDIIFYRIVGLLKKLKQVDSDKVRYTLENLCYIFSIQKDLNHQSILKKMYSLLEYDEFY